MKTYFMLDSMHSKTNGTEGNFKTNTEMRSSTNEKYSSSAKIFELQVALPRFLDSPPLLFFIFLSTTLSRKSLSCPMPRSALCFLYFRPILQTSLRNVLSILHISLPSPPKNGNATHSRVANGGLQICPSSIEFMSVRNMNTRVKRKCA